MLRRESRDSGVFISYINCGTKRHSAADSLVSSHSSKAGAMDEEGDAYICGNCNSGRHGCHDEGFCNGSGGDMRSKKCRVRSTSQSSDAFDTDSEQSKYETREKHYLQKVDDCLTKDPNLREEQVKLILQSFSVLDENGDGKISKGEICRAYRLAGFNPTPSEIEEIIKEHDVNSDGYIDFDEYFNVMRTKMIKLDFDKDRLKTAFRVLDMDGDGYLTVEELRHALNKSGGHFTEAEIKDIITKADKNNDGMIDYNEFVEADLCKSVF